MDILNHLNLRDNQLQNAVIHPSGTAPTAVLGKLYFNSNEGEQGQQLMICYNGVDWRGLLDGRTNSIANSMLKAEIANDKLANYSTSVNDIRAGGTKIMSSGAIHSAILNAIGETDAMIYKGALAAGGAYRRTLTFVEEQVGATATFNVTIGDYSFTLTTNKAGFYDNLKAALNNCGYPYQLAGSSGGATVTIDIFDNSFPSFTKTSGYGRVDSSTATNIPYGTLTPAADKGHTYKIKNKGYVDGVLVGTGDMIICNSDNTPQATSSNYDNVAKKWDYIKNDIGSYVSSFGSLSGDITIDSGNTTNGQVKFSMSGSMLKGSVNGLAAAAYKAVDIDITPGLSESTNLPTTAAVVSFVEGKGYLTSHRALKFSNNGGIAGAIPDGTLTFDGGSNVTLGLSGSVLTINATDTTYTAGNGLSLNSSNVFSINDSVVATKNFVSSNYLPLSGGTISGSLTVGNDIQALGKIWLNESEDAFIGYDKSDETIFIYNEDYGGIKIQGRTTINGQTVITNACKASDLDFGIVKIGDNINVTDGVISVSSINGISFNTSTEQGHHAITITNQFGSSTSDKVGITVWDSVLTLNEASTKGVDATNISNPTSDSHLPTSKAVVSYVSSAISSGTAAVAKKVENALTIKLRNTSGGDQGSFAFDGSVANELDIVSNTANSGITVTGTKSGNQLSLSFAVDDTVVRTTNYASSSTFGIVKVGSYLSASNGVLSVNATSLATQLESTFVKKSGDTMTGSLALDTGLILNNNSVNGASISYKDGSATRMLAYYSPTQHKILLGNSTHPINVEGTLTVGGVPVATDNDIAPLAADIAAIRENMDELGDVHAKSIDMDELPKVCHYDMILFGTAKPTTTPDFVGQKFIDTVHGDVYEATGVSNANSWTPLNDRNTYTRKYVATITGDGSKKTWTINHNLNSICVNAQVYEGDYQQVLDPLPLIMVDIKLNTSNQLYISFGQAPSSSQKYTVVIIG